MKKLQTRADLILHPVRVQIVAALSLRDATPKQLAERLGDVAVSSLYRHLNLLLEGGVVEVVRREQVGSVEEKTYRLVISDDFTAEDIEMWTPEEYERYFTAAVLSITTSMKRYVSLEPDFDEVKRRSVWQTVTLNASEAAWQEALKEIHEILGKLESSNRSDTQKRQLYLISHPLIENEPVEE